MKEYKDVQRHLLPVFRAFVDFCNRNQLTYYAAYGTVIGAVRHKGFIPWDDDIDVWMPRRDYERFLSLRDKLISTHYEIIDIEDKGYYLYFAKFCDRRSTIIEREGQSIMGLYIDVFPLDYYDDKGGETIKESQQYILEIMDLL